MCCGLRRGASCMLTGRSVIIIVVVVLLISLVTGTLSLLGPRDGEGKQADTFGTRPRGFRAIYEVLADLNIPVERTVSPPTESLDRPVTVIFWGPNSDLVWSEPAYLQQVSQWTRQGGRVVVAPETHKDRFEELKHKHQDENSPIKPTTILKELGLGDVQTENVNLDWFDGTAAAKSSRKPRSPINRPRPNFEEELREHMLPTVGPSRQVEIEAEGDLAPLVADVKYLQLPDELQTLVLGDTKPSGKITVRLSEDDAPLVIAARYPLDKGEVLIISDRDLFENRLISQDDNSVLAVRLLAGDDRILLWDEFYHGLTIRGQPLFLLTRGAYALFALLCVATTALYVWRAAVFLGPPLAAVETMRRTLAEYVSAMARFFNRGPGSRHFVVGEVRTGVLWSLRKKMGLSPAEQSPEILAAAIARRDPRAARQLIDAVAAADLTLSATSRITERRTLQVLKGLDDCL
jgi:hypothetical protein